LLGEKGRQGDKVTRGETGRKNANLILQLGLWNQQTQLGEVFDSSTGFSLPNGADRSPDVAWLEKSRWESLSQQQRETFIESRRKTNVL